MSLFLKCEEKKVQVFGKESQREVQRFTEVVFVSFPRTPQKLAANGFITYSSRRRRGAGVSGEHELTHTSRFRRRCLLSLSPRSPAFLLSPFF